MHILNLGLLQNVTAEGILWLVEHKVHGGTTLDDGLRLAYNAFQVFLRRNRISCSQRRFTRANMHLSDATPDFPYLSAKAFNCRVILAWLDDPWPSSCFPPTICPQNNLKL